LLSPRLITMHSGASRSPEVRPKSLSILGSTGSIGVSTLEIVKAHPDRFRVASLTGGRNLERIADQIRSFQPDVAAVLDPSDAEKLRRIFGKEGPKILSGIEGYIACALHAPVDMVVSAIVGAAGLVPTIAAIESGKDIALANKETLVCGGSLVMEAIRRNGVALFPVDSEHSAIFQALAGNRKTDVSRLILTASGGPFRDRPFETFSKVLVSEALAHPNWRMGKKITIDSATMMNKGLEVIEAHWLFDLPLDKIDVMIHPESIVHSMVEYADGSVIAQMGLPDMKTPIAYALSYPERLVLDLPFLDLTKLGSLNFRGVDREKFACLNLAYRALRSGGTAPAVLNAANEAAVEAFLEEKIRFSDIPLVIDQVLEMHSPEPLKHLDEVLKADLWGRREALKMIDQLGAAERKC